MTILFQEAMHVLHLCNISNMITNYNVKPNVYNYIKH